MSVVFPSWFKGRQCKAEPQGEHMLKLTGPNLSEAYIFIRREQDGWLGGLRRAPDGPDEAVTEPEFPTDKEAWQAAFELYRRHLIV